MIIELLEVDQLDFGKFIIIKILVACSLQRLNEEIDGGDILFRGNLITKDSWTLNKFHIISKLNFALIKTLNYIAINNKLPRYEDISLHFNKLYKIDNPISPIIYIFKKLIPLIVKFLP